LVFSDRGASTLRVEAEECDSPRSEFSLTSEWQNMLAAGNAAGMSTRDCDSSANYSEYENPYDVLNSSDAMYRAHRAHAQVMSTEPCRIRSMELRKVSRVHDPNLPQRHSAPQQRRTVNYGTITSCAFARCLFMSRGIRILYQAYPQCLFMSYDSCKLYQAYPQ